MHTDVEVSYRLLVTSNEFRLIGLALAGKLKDADDIKEAKLLNVHVCHQRATHIKSQLEAAEQSAKLAKKEVEL